MASNDSVSPNDEYITYNQTSPYFMRNVTEVNFGPVMHHDRNNRNGMGTKTVMHEERNWVVVGILIGLIVILWVILAFMLCVPLIRCIKRKIPVSRKRLNRRYETVEGWLITKLVKNYDDCSQRIQDKYAVKDVEESTTVKVGAGPGVVAGDGGAAAGGGFGGSSGTFPVDVKPADSVDFSDTQFDAASIYSQSENMMECPICMESFKVDQIVSWSAFEKCSHVFHHECIKEWLLRHKNCPFCREVFLPVDQEHIKTRRSKMLLFKELADIRSKRSDTTYFCIEKGLVVIDRKAMEEDKSNLTKAETEAIKSKIKSGVHKSELKKMRGSRIDKETMHGGSDVEDLLPVIDTMDDDDDDINNDFMNSTEDNNSSNGGSNTTIDCNNNNDERHKDVEGAGSSRATESSPSPAWTSQRTEPINFSVVDNSLVSSPISVGDGTADVEIGINPNNNIVIDDNNLNNGKNNKSDHDENDNNNEHHCISSTDESFDQSVEAIIIKQGSNRNADNNSNMIQQKQPEEQQQHSLHLSSSSNKHENILDESTSTIVSQVLDNVVVVNTDTSSDDTLMETLVVDPSSSSDNNSNEEIVVLNNNNDDKKYKNQNNHLEIDRSKLCSAIVMKDTEEMSESVDTTTDNDNNMNNESCNLAASGRISSNSDIAINNSGFEVRLL